MLKNFGFSSEMLVAERTARITISFSLLFLLIVPFLPILFLGAGPFALFYPLLILPGFWTLTGRCPRFNPFYLLFALICSSLIATASFFLPVIILLPIFLFGFMLYFQAERRMYYLIELQKKYPDIDDGALDMKQFCRLYLFACCRNAILPTIVGCVFAVALAFGSGAAAWPVSIVCLAILAIWHFAASRKA